MGAPGIYLQHANSHGSFLDSFCLMFRYFVPYGGCLLFAFLLAACCSRNVLNMPPQIVHAGFLALMLILALLFVVLTEFINDRSLFEGHQGYYPELVHRSLFIGMLMAPFLVMYKAACLWGVEVQWFGR